MWNGQVPFDVSSGKPLYYGGSGTNTIWRDNFEFQDTLVFSGFTRGRSAVHAHFKSKTNSTSFVVFLSDLAKMIPNLVGGVAEGKFTFCKRGSNYGLKMIPK